ncbi:hypothetical protein NCCP1664_01960 [Zafaria cholistanensis]|uniref:Uncharacterized protein n=1 Tax=Zafaria cholistanensis TaxID=1682741 RepID=A0A5A7NMB2_9MICC|nr:hypothetical protein NCCP1664_01960 [Zafaria cholistanensis]
MAQDYDRDPQKEGDRASLKEVTKRAFIPDTGHHKAEGPKQASPTHNFALIEAYASRERHEKHELKANGDLS